MTKKKSTGWARMKLLLLLPVVALSVYAFARPDGTQQLEQVIRSESTTIAPTNQNYTLEFFETELNNFIHEQGGSASLSSDEKLKYLSGKTNVFYLFVNLNDKILFNNVVFPIEQISSELTKKLVADYPNKKPVSIYMLSDHATSSGTVTKILNIVGKTFFEHEKSDKQKNQPILLLYGTPKQYGKKSIPEN